MTTVNDLLDQYGLTRDTATAYIDAITRLNQTETADELDVSRDTIHRYKNEFADMTGKERAFLIVTLFDEYWREAVRNSSDEE